MVVKNRERKLNATHNDFRVSGAHLKKMTERNTEALKEIFFVKSVNDVSTHHMVRLKGFEPLTF